MSLSKQLTAFVFVFTLFSSFAHAASFTTTTSGSWSNGSTWGNSSPGTEGVDYPGLNDDATIVNSVSLTGNQSVHNVFASTTGSLSLSTFTLTVSGDFKNDGTFNANTGTVNLTGTSSAVLGGATFYNLTKSVDITSSSIAFDPRATTTVTHTLNLSGTASNPLTVQNGGTYAPTFERSWGRKLYSANGQFNQPHGVAVSPITGDIYVVDINNNRVQIFNSAGVYQSQFGSYGSGNGQFSNPRGIAISTSTGDVYVSDIGNVNIQRFNSAGVYQSQFGSYGSGNGQFDNPYDVAVSPVNGDIYVADYGNSRIQRFNSAGVYQSKFGSAGSGNGQFSGPNGIAISTSTGDIYVVDAGNYRVQRFNSAGVYQSQFGGSGSGNGLFNGLQGGIAISSLTGNVYVVDAENSRVQRFSSTGTYQAQFGSAGSGNGQFSSPRGIAISTSTGDVYVIDATNYRVQRFNSAGVYQSQFGNHNEQGGQFAGADGIAIDSSGNNYIVDTFKQRIQKFDSSGEFIKLFGWGVSTGASAFETCTVKESCLAGLTGSGNGQFGTAHAVAIHPTTGYVYISDTSNSRIQVFDTSGNYVTNFGSSGTGDGQFGQPYGLAFDSSGYLYVADAGPGSGGSTAAGNDRIEKFDVSGTPTFISSFGSKGTGDGQFNKPHGIYIARDGSIYVSDTQNHRIQKFDRNGNFILKWGTHGTAEGQLEKPQGITEDGGGNIYVADNWGNVQWNNRVQKFTPNGTFLATWGWGVQDGTSVFQECIIFCRGGIGPTSNNGIAQFNAPHGVDIDSNGNLYVTNFFGDDNYINKFSPTSTTSPLSISGSASLSYLSVENSRSGSNVSCANCTDGGGNTNWTFVSSLAVTTSSASNITRTQAVLNGSISSTGGADASDHGFYWGTTSSYGNTVHTESSIGATTFSESISGLSCATTYHFQAYATNIAGTVTGSDNTFVTDPCLSSSSSVSGGGGGGYSPAPVVLPSTVPAVRPAGCPAGFTCTPITPITTPITTTSFVRPIALGTQGNDVRTLQKYLNAKGYTVAPNGAGSPGNESDFFGRLTQKALMRFQKDHGIPATGYFGPITRAYILKNM